jgi:hypothetical protein
MEEQLLKLIPFKIAVRLLLILSCLALIFHILVLVRIIPFSIVWGGRISTVSEMQRFEITSLFINGLLLFVVMKKGGLISLNLPSSLTQTILWFYVISFIFNTLGNLFAKADLESLIFTPLTIVSAILCYRIVREKQLL